MNQIIKIINTFRPQFKDKMDMINEHIAFYISNNDNKLSLIQQIRNGNIVGHLKSLKGELYSEITLKQFIDEEIRHEHFSVINGQKNSLRKYSDGEKKKALLSYIISKNPDYIIVDNIFDNMDAASQLTIIDTIAGLSKNKVIVQITNRKSDVLHFIKKLYTLKGDKIVLLENTNGSATINPINFINSIPLPYHSLHVENNPLIKFNHVTVKYDERTIVKDICWEIKSNEFWQLMGPNGSGKSTLLSLINGDNPKAYGQDITLFGVKKGSGESIWDIKKKIGYLSSEMAIGFLRSDSIENMILSGFFDSFGLYVKPTNIQIKIAREWLILLDMDEKKKQPFLSLSAGHQRLVLIARAMIKHPPLLILDEPTVGLDDHDVLLFSELINKIAAESTTAILFVSHRKEMGLNPQYIFELKASEQGSLGKQF